MFHLSKKTIIMLTIGFVLVLLIVIGNYYQLSLTPRAKPIINPPITGQPCGIENCHGLDLECGPNIAEVCTMEYRFGDQCRQYASCQEVDGACQKVTTPQFDTCKDCVNSCLARYGEYAPELWQCESECR